MLNGIDPIIIFQFSSLASSNTSDVGPVQPGLISKIPFISQIPTLIEQPPIPIYLSESITGIFIDSEDKNVDIETSTETMTDGSDPAVAQKGIGSSITINIVGVRDSIGLSLLSAMIDQAFDKVTSQEYAITYLHGAITIFRGLIQSFAINQNSSDDKLTIKIELTKGKKQPTKKPATVSVPGQVGTLPGG